MMQQDIVRLDHCQMYYTWAGPLWNVAKDMAGWIALTSSGDVQFFGNSPFSRGDADWVVPVTEVTNLSEAPKYMGISYGLNRALRAKFASRDRIVSFTGLKKGLSKNDRMIGHAPVAGHIYMAAKLLVNDLPGSGDRALEAANVWRRVLGGDVPAGELPVIGAIQA
jgi:hypothetical protein